MKKIAIFGGTFDPFTVAHAAIVKKLFDYVDVDKVIISPTITSWYRNNDENWLTDDQRIACCRAAVDYIKDQDVKKHDALTDKSDDEKIYDIEVNGYDIYAKRSFDDQDDQNAFVENYHYYDTLVNLRTTYKAMFINEDVDFYTVIGSDQLENFKNWYRWEDVCKMSKLLVVNNRNRKHVDSDIQHIDIEIDEKFWNVSASEIRKKYALIDDGFKQYLKTFKPMPRDVLLMHTPIFDLVQKPAPYEDKPEFCPYAVKSPDWVTVIVEQNGKFCCVKQLRYGLMKECDEFIAGMVDENEEPLHAAKRELNEETGILLTNGVSDIEYLGKFAANPAFMTNYMHYFYVNLDEAEFVQEDQKLDEHEKLEISWKDKNEMLKKWFDGSSVLLGGAFLKMIQNGIVKCNAFS